ncbi:MAG: aldo/keto reductase [Pseudomonadota bacterium]
MTTDAQLTCPDGTPISEFCFGTMQFGVADQAESQAMFEACRGAGINFFDTAYIYTNGDSEKWLGGMIQTERDRLYIASKVAYKDGAGQGAITAQMDESRQRLQLDTVDAYYLHRWDPKTPLEETFETLAELKSRGWFRDIGVSNFAAWQVMKAVRVAARFDLTIKLLQPMYNLVKRQAEVELLPMAADQDIAVMPYSPLGGGLLTGKYQQGETGRLSTNRMYAARYSDPWMHETAGAFVKLATEAGMAPATLAVAWVAAQPGVTAPIISARTVSQLGPSLDAMSLEVSADLMAQVTALSRTPPPATDRSEEADA